MSRSKLVAVTLVEFIKLLFEEDSNSWFLDWLIHFCSIEQLTPNDSAASSLESSFYYD